MYYPGADIDFIKEYIIWDRTFERTEVLLKFMKLLVLRKWERRFV